MISKVEEVADQHRIVCLREGADTYFRLTPNSRISLAEFGEAVVKAIPANDLPEWRNLRIFADLPSPAPGVSKPLNPPESLIYTAEDGEHAVYHPRSTTWSFHNPTRTAEYVCQPSARIVATQGDPHAVRQITGTENPSHILVLPTVRWHRLADEGAPSSIGTPGLSDEETGGDMNGSEWKDLQDRVQHCIEGPPREASDGARMIETQALKDEVTALTDGFKQSLERKTSSASASLIDQLTQKGWKIAENSNTPPSRA